MHGWIFRYIDSSFFSKLYKFFHLNNSTFLKRKSFPLCKKNKYKILCKYKFKEIYKKDLEAKVVWKHWVLLNLDQC